MLQILDWRAIETEHLRIDDVFIPDVDVRNKNLEAGDRGRERKSATLQGRCKQARREVCRTLIAARTWNSIQILKLDSQHPLLLARQ